MDEAQAGLAVNAVDAPPSSDRIKLYILMLLLPIAGWMARGGLDQSARITAGQNYIQEADTLYHQNQYPEAISRLELSLGQDPYCYQAYQNMASYYFLNRAPALAIQTCLRGLNFLPNDLRLEQDLGELYLADHQFDKAIPHLTRAIAGLPPDPHLQAALDQAQRKTKEKIAGKPDPSVTPQANHSTTQKADPPAQNANP